MIGLFCGTKTKNIEEYRKVIKSRMNLMVLIGLIGIITLTIALLAEFKWDVGISEHMLGLYSGMGTGLLFASIVLWVKSKLLLGNEGKLRKSRLDNTDERIQEISNKAFRVATIMLLIALYAIALIGGLFYPFLTKVPLCTVFVFLLSYMIAYRIYEKKM